MMQRPGGIPVPTPCLFRHFAEGTCGIRTHISRYFTPLRRVLPIKLMSLCRNPLYFRTLTASCQCRLNTLPFTSRGVWKKAPDFILSYQMCTSGGSKASRFDVRDFALRSCRRLRISPTKWDVKDLNLRLPNYEFGPITTWVTSLVDAESVGLPDLQPRIKTGYALSPPAYRCRFPIRIRTGNSGLIPTRALTT